jgi:hypothetical protein
MANTFHPTPGTAAAHTGALAVYDGQTRLGHLVHRDDGFEAFDLDGASCGVFAAMKDAAFAIPAKSARE